ncbi:MAG: phenylalanine--tRNA ligase subunit alpha [Opitutales bacterium]
MATTFETLKSEALTAIQSCKSVVALQEVKTQFLGPKSTLITSLKNLKNLPLEEKIQSGKEINGVKAAIEALLSQKQNELQTQERLKKLGDPIDPSLEGPYPQARSLHPLTQTRQRILSIFKQLGYAVAEGPEIETEWFCFDALNVPKHHPARAAQDTFFFEEGKAIGTTSQKEDEFYLLRTQTSTVQIRTLAKHTPPFKVISPGRVFRRDTVDATHNFNFHQIEGLCIDKKTSIVDLKGTLDYFVQKFFGKAFKTRMRPSYFPFTEPSFEMDIFVPKLGKFKDTWIEVWGCGMVNRNVLSNAGLNPDEWQGFAFGFGVERLAMLLYGIEDIRRFYQNDTRFLTQF